MYSFLKFKKADPSGICSEAFVINFIFPVLLSVSTILFFPVLLTFIIFTGKPASLNDINSGLIPNSIFEKF